MRINSWQSSSFNGGHPNDRRHQEEMERLFAGHSVVPQNVTRHATKDGRQAKVTSTFVPDSLELSFARP